jgi:hypothetical protein
VTSKGTVLLATASASGVATVDFTSGIDSTYEEYELHIINAVPASGAVPWLRTSADAGSNWASSSSNYEHTLHYADGGGAAASSSATDTALVLAGSTASNTTALGGVSGVIRIFNPAGTTHNKRLAWQLSLNTGTGSHIASGTGTRAATAAINDLRVLFSTGNVASGLFKLYGVKK